jgi:hypothetical protein
MLNALRALQLALRDYRNEHDAWLSLADQHWNPPPAAGVIEAASVVVEAAERGGLIDR